MRTLHRRISAVLFRFAVFAILTSPTPQLHAIEATAEVFTDSNGISVTVGEVEHYFSKWGPGASSDLQKIPNVEMAVEYIYAAKKLSVEATALEPLESEVIEYIRAESVRRKQMASYLDEEVASRISETDWPSIAYEHYLANPDQFTEAPKIAASHILFKTEGKRLLDVMLYADEVRRDILAGQDFSLAADQYSESEAALPGGDLGFFTRGQMVPAFEETAFSLDVGEVSDLVITRFGVHLIRVTARREPTKRSFDSVKSGLIDRLKKRAVSEYRQQITDAIISSMLRPPAVMNTEIIESIRAGKD